MKAIEILEDLCTTALDNEGYIRWEVTMNYVKGIRESIAELRELENRSCEGCKNYKPQTNLSACPIAEYCSRGINDFYTPKEESK